MHLQAACHVHSDWSYDGKWSLERIAKNFSKRGYQVVMVTEHDRGFSETRRLEHREACRNASSDRVLMVPGIEYSDGANCVHILAWGNVPFVGENMETEKILRAAADCGGVAVLAHPSRKQAWRSFDPALSPGLLGIEYWNRKTDGWAPSPNAGDLLRATGVLPFVGLDFHEPRQFFPLAMLLDINPPLTEESVLDALRAKRCSPQAFGLPVRRFSHGLGARTLQTAEALRRPAARFYRKLWPV